MGLGLHSLTGSRKVIDIIHKLGHSISYNTVCEIETAQAECGLVASKSLNVLALQPTLPDQTVFTHFWVDNFDLKIDRIGGGGSIHTTHLMAFQEKQPHCRPKQITVTVPRMKRRVLFYEDVTMEPKRVDVYKEPGSITSNMNVSYSQEKEVLFNNLYAIWLYIRKQNSSNQESNLKFSSLKMIKYTQVNKVLKLRTCEVGDFLKLQLEKCVKISIIFCTLTLFWNEQKLMYLKMLIHSSLIQVRKLLCPHVDEYRRQIPRNERSSKTWKNLSSSSNQARH